MGGEWLWWRGMPVEERSRILRKAALARWRKTNKGRKYVVRFLHKIIKDVYIYAYEFSQRRLPGH